MDQTVSFGQHEDITIPATDRMGWRWFLVLVVIFGVVTVGLLFVRYQETSNLAQERVDNLAGVYNENMLLLMSNLESIMRATSSEFRNAPDSESLHTDLVSIASQLPQLRTLLIVDPSGIVIADSRPNEAAVGLDVVDRAYFQAHVNTQSQDLFIDNPVQSRVDGDWSLPISLGVWNSDDEFLGAVVASIDPIFFSGSLNAFSTDTLSGYLVNGAGQILTTIPYQDEAIAVALIDPAVLGAISNAESTQPTQLTFLNQDSPAIAGYRFLPLYDFGIVFTQSRNEVLTAFMGEIVLALVVLMALVSITFVAFRYQIRQTNELRSQVFLRQRVAYQVEHERKMLRTLIDNIPDYIFIKDQDGRFTETNIAHSKSVNVTRREMLNRTALELFDPDLAQQFHLDDEQVLKEGQSIINEERVTVGNDGTQRWVLTTKVPLRDQRGQIIGLVGISRDITERREAKATHLAAERLRLEVEKERQVIDLKQRFITTASHDFRTPLTIMKTGIEMLQRYYEKLSPERRLEKLDQIHKQIYHMTNLLDQVLTIGKLQSERLVVKLVPIDLPQFCEAIWQDMIALDGDRHIKQFSYGAEVQEFYTDERLLQQVLVNLLSNAFKYTGENGKIEFIIESNTEWVTFYVRDEGYGIPKEEQKHLFEPFYRASNVANLQGTGLGLVIAKEYVQFLGGSLEVESAVNVGTTFMLQLPIITVALQAPTETSISAE